MQVKPFNSSYGSLANTIQSGVEGYCFATTIGPIKLVIIGDRHNSLGVIP
jgi:hypothetical protein